MDVLDFTRLREVLASHCATDHGRELALALEPESDAGKATRELDRLEALLAFDAEPPLAGVRDIRPLLVQARAGSALSGPELVRVLKTCEAVRLCRDFFARQAGKQGALDALTRRLGAWPELESEIAWALDESGEVRDAATPELERIRGELRRRRDDLLNRLESIVADNPAWFEGPVGVRADRFVVPVRLEEKSRVAGVVHSASGTGQTLFVEPLQTIAEQNEVQELRDAEAQEQARVLRHLTGLVAANEAELASALSGAAQLDLVTAKRRLARRFDCTRPEIDDGRGLLLVKARHPLLLLRKVAVVPLDLAVEPGTRVILVSGPNAGGKTVVLKTVGLLSLMLGAGMFVPAAQGTRLPLFHRVFADIGDEQSLDANLSSFTAHLSRLKEIVEAADSQSLVLVDEIGSSTAPEEGAALAIAVLETLYDAGALSVATTHFGALKMFVQGAPGMTNVAMEFRNGPTYRLIPGTPGESSALDIAERAGMPAHVLERARARMGREWLDLGERLKALGAELDEAQRSRQRAELSQQQADRLRQDYESRAAEFKEWRAAERTRLARDQERLLRDARRQIENLVREIRESGAGHEAIVAAKGFVERKLAEVEQPPEEASAPPSTELAVGDTVESRTFRRQGTVVSVEEGTVTVAFGNIRVALERGDLRRAQEPAEPKAETETGDDSYRFEPRLDVRGMDRLDAEQAVGRFLDDAQMSGASEVSVLHGTGTGALRRMIWNRLRHDRRVAELHSADKVDGGSGVTVVKMKDVQA